MNVLICCKKLLHIIHYYYYYCYYYRYYYSAVGYKEKKCGWMFSQSEDFIVVVSVITRTCSFILVINVSDKCTASVFRLRAGVEWTVGRLATVWMAWDSNVLKGKRFSIFHTRPDRPLPPPPQPPAPWEPRLYPGIKRQDSGVYH